jgi:hypothetical protein
MTRHLARAGLVAKALLVVTMLAKAVGCGGDDDGPPGGGTPDAGPAPVTFWQNAKPILDAKCIGCHSSGGIAPFNLTDYDSAYEQRAFIKDAVKSRVMPPWLAGDGCDDYEGDRRLTDAQIATLVAWVDQGAPIGDASKPGAAIDPGPEIQLSRVDRTIGLAAPYMMSITPDEYRCFVLDWPETTTKYLTGFRANPGNKAIVHHVIAYYASPANVAEAQKLDSDAPGDGYPCFGGPGFKGNWLGSWAPGSRGSDFPAGTGLKIESGSKVVVQIHYNAQGTALAMDQTTVDFKLDDSVAREARIQPFADPQWLNAKTMNIPAGEKDVKHAFAADLSAVTGGKPFDLYSVGFHQHQLGVGGRVELRRADGTSDCLLDIPRWDFHWQGSYQLAAPKRVTPGDQLSIECHWDNTAANQPTIGGVQLPPKDVNWGEGTGDEMCLSGFYVVPAP